MKSETDDGLSSCSNFPARSTETEISADKHVLPEIDISRFTQGSAKSECRRFFEA